MTDKELLMLLRELTTLTHLSLIHAKKLFSKEFRKLFKDIVIPRLSELTIGYCAMFSNKDLTVFTKCLPSLKDLELRCVNGVTDKGLESLIKTCGILEMLVLTDMKHVTESCLQDVAEKLPNLRALTAKRCPLVANGTDKEIISNRNYRLLLKKDFPKCW